MTTRNTKLYSRDSNGVTYSDPLSVSGYSVRFKTVPARKTIDGLLLQNVATEIIIADTHPVSVGDKTVNDPLSIRIRTSGAVNSSARITAVLQAVAAQLPTWVSEDVFLGYEPTTVPVNVI